MVDSSSDVKIIELLFDRDEYGLTQISDRYKHLYISILRQLLNDEQDILECENDILLAVWNSIPPNRPDNLCAYVCKLARNISINKFKYNSREKRAAGYAVILDELSECIPDKSPACNSETAVENKEITDALLRFVKQLDAQTRILFIRRYFYLESVSSLSERYKIAENKISVKLFRARKKLHTFLKKEELVL